LQTQPPHPKRYYSSCLFADSGLILEVLYDFFLLKRVEEWVDFKYEMGDFKWRLYFMDALNKSIFRRGKDFFGESNFDSFFWIKLCQTDSFRVFAVLDIRIGYQRDQVTNSSNKIKEKNMKKKKKDKKDKKNEKTWKKITSF
jgi:hypothetical protein